MARRGVEGVDDPSSWTLSLIRPDVLGTLVIEFDVRVDVMVDVMVSRRYSALSICARANWLDGKSDEEESNDGVDGRR